MIHYLLDTNVVSYFMKQHALAASYNSLTQGASLAISFMTIAELHEGAIRANWGAAKMAALGATLNSYVVYNTSAATCRIWADIRAMRRNSPIAVDDAWIAAIALEYSFPLVTHNRQDFQGIPNLKIISAMP